MKHLGTGHPLQTLDLNGPVAYIDVPGPSEDAPVMVLVHGLGSSHLAWLALIPELTATHRVLAPDLPGFGFSPPGARVAGVTENADILVQFIRALTDRPVTLVGNSLGGMIATLVLGSNPELLDDVVLIDPALPAAFTRESVKRLDPRSTLFFVLYNIPRVGERFMRWRRESLDPRRSVELLLDGVCADPSAVDPELVEIFVRSAEARRLFGWSDDAFLQAERSMMRMLTRHKASYLDTLATSRIPILLVHGELDQLVNIESARRVAAASPAVELVALPGIGHVPQIECPVELATLMIEWLDGDQTAP